MLQSLSCGLISDSAIFGPTQTRCPLSLTLKRRIRTLQQQNKQNRWSFPKASKLEPGSGGLFFHDANSSRPPLQYYRELLLIHLSPFTVALPVLRFTLRQVLCVT